MLAPMVLFWAVLVFVVGLNVGSFLNVVASRMPLEKSLLWPGSRCGACLQPIRWYDNLPILGYLVLRGRCRTCGTSYGVRYLLVELTTGLAFLGLFWLELVVNIHDWPGAQAWAVRQGWFPLAWWAGYAYHAVLLTLLLGASICDIERREIPLPLTLRGTAIGLVGAALMPWPWPWLPIQAAPNVAAFPHANPVDAPRFAWMFGEIRGGVQAWPAWGPLPDFCHPGGNWQTGLLTGVAGALVGTFLLRAVAFSFGFGLKREAMGLGDADLMMMAGAFLGWQPVVAAFFLATIPAAFVGAANLLVKSDNSLPFGPSLAIGLMASCLGWRWIGPYLQPLAFWGPALLGLLAAMVVFLFLTGFLFGRLRG